MRIQFVAIGLAAILFVSSLAAAVLCLWYVWSYRQNMVVQNEMVRLNNVSAAVRSLVVDSFEYSKSNPSMLPVLKQFSIVPRAVATNQPPAAPGGPLHGPK
jgi:hypothetical protein